MLASDMAGHQGEAWTDFEYRKAQELDSWQTTADTNYKTYVSSLANDEVTYATTDSSKFLSEAQTIDAADETDGDGAADADQALVNTLASDEVTYETAASTATAAWQTSMAQAAHDNVVAIANAIDTYAHDGNTTNYNSALAAAATALATAQTNAATTYSKAIGPATATQETNDANATLTDVQTDAGADLTDAKTADLQIDTYSNAESDAFDAQTKSDAQAFDTLEKGDADSLATDAAYQDGQYPSPRMDYWKAQTAAEDAKDDANADATLTQTGTTSDAQDTQEKTAANAEQTKDDNAAQSAHDKTVNDAQAVHDKAIADANSITAAVAKNAYTATLPGPYAAFDWSQMTDPSILDAGYDELYAVDDLPLSLAAGQDDGASPLPGGDVIGSPTSSPQPLVPHLQPPLSAKRSLFPARSILTVRSRA